MNEPVPGIVEADIAASAASTNIEKGIALCLSGGGYRAMLFHAGVLWRLQELRYLDCTSGHPLHSTHGCLECVSSVSGGSIIAGLLALKWGKCETGNSDVQMRTNALLKHVVEPIRTFSQVNIAGTNAAGVLGVLGAVILPGSVNDHVTKKYAKHLYGDATLQALPGSPRFVINASNLQSGAVFRFTKKYIRDYRVGEIRNTALVTVARAVASSSAFPPPLSPAVLNFKESDFTPATGQDLQRPPFTTRIVLSDGGVYDNLGLEPAKKRYKTLFVSNAGKPFGAEEKPSINWLSQATRVLGVMDNQVLALRVRSLIETFQMNQTAPQARSGCYWGISSDPAKYPRPSTLSCLPARTQELAGIATDLAEKSNELQERLINWGYAICDTSIRSWVDPTIPQPSAFPYSVGV